MHDTLIRYLALRKLRLIGMLWVEADCLFLAPLDAIHGFNVRENISWANLIRKVEEVEMEGIEEIKKRSSS